MRVPVVVSVVLFLLAQPAVSQVPDDQLIVPGQRIGKWTLTMTVDAIVKAMGEPSLLIEGLSSGAIKTQPGVLYYDWTGPSALGLATRDDRTILLLYTSASLRYKTAEGLKYGAPLGSAESSYGEPTKSILTSAGPGGMPGGLMVIYDRLGLAVRYWEQAVRIIIVFRPETAKSIWKY